MSSGFPGPDAQCDFSRARRCAPARRYRPPAAARARRRRADPPVRGGRRGARPDRPRGPRAAGGPAGRDRRARVDRAADFDRGFRPTSPRLRSRWERIAAAQRRGESLPPISLYRVGDLYFVRDGHHRVSVAKSLGRTDIDAYVTEVETRVRLGERPAGLRPAAQGPRAAVPRARPARRARCAARIALTDPWDFGTLAEAVEAWGFRAMQDRGSYMDRARGRPPVVHGRVPPGGRDAATPASCCSRDETETDAYLRISGDALPRPAHARVERRRARGAAPRDDRAPPPAPPAAAEARPPRKPSGA